MFGKERTLVASLAILSFGVLLAALASSIGLLILARVIQGSGGAIFPLAFGIIRDEFPRDKAAQGIAMISAILGIGGGLGIILAGPMRHLRLSLALLVPPHPGARRHPGDDLLRPRIAGEVAGPGRLDRNPLAGRGTTEPSRGSLR